MSLFRLIQMLIIRIFYPERTALEGRDFVAKRERRRTSIRDIRLDGTGKPMFVQDVKKGKRFL